MCSKFFLLLQNCIYSFCKYTKGFLLTKRNHPLCFADGEGSQIPFSMLLQGTLWDQGSMRYPDVKNSNSLSFSYSSRKHPRKAISFSKNCIQVDELLAKGVNVTVYNGQVRIPFSISPTIPYLWKRSLNFVLNCEEHVVQNENRVD